MVVDDDDNVRTSLESLLRVSGIAVAGFDRAEAALAALASLRPACVVTDLQMPGMDGFALMRELRRRLPGLRLVAVTGRYRSVDRELALAAGADAFLRKPVDPDRLLAAIGLQQP